jgi:hypothetical protein
MSGQVEAVVVVITLFSIIAQQTPLWAGLPAALTHTDFRDVVVPYWMGAVPFDAACTHSCVCVGYDLVS